MLVFDMFKVTSMIAMTLLKSSFWCIIIKFMVIICGDICMVYNILGVKHSPPSGQLSLVLQLHPKDVYITTYISLHINLKLMYATFCQFFIFSPNDSPSKTTENVLYFNQKALFVLEMFNFLIFSLFSILCRFKRTDGSGIMLIFGIIQKPFYVISSNLVR